MWLRTLALETQWCPIVGGAVIHVVKLSVERWSSDEVGRSQL